MVASPPLSIFTFTPTNKGTITLTNFDTNLKQLCIMVREVNQLINKNMKGLQHPAIITG